jgi:hypothetical protein
MVSDEQKKKQQNQHGIRRTKKNSNKKNSVIFIDIDNVQTCRDTTYSRWWTWQGLGATSETQRVLRAAASNQVKNACMCICLYADWRCDLPYYSLCRFIRSEKQRKADMWVGWVGLFAENNSNVYSMQWNHGGVWSYLCHERGTSE